MELVMSNNKKSKRVVDLHKEVGDDVTKDYEEGMHVKELAVKYECSNNTMMVLIGVLGFEVEPWAKDQVERKLEYIKREKSKRVRVNTDLGKEAV
jgi:uncharacterized protein YjcR